MTGFSWTDADHLTNYRALHGPSWRWRVAGEKVNGGNFAFLAEKDPLAGMAAEYRCLLAEGPDGTEKARRKQPWIALACELNENEAKVSRIKVLVLGGFQPHEITQQYGLDPTVFRTWADLFFDVGGPNRCTDWLDRHVVRPTYEVDVDLAIKMQLAAVGGRAAVWMIAEDDAQEALGQARKLIHERFRLSARVAAGNSIPLGTQRAALKQLKAFGEITLGEQRIKLAEQKLGEHCREAERKHQVRLLREKRIQERERGRLAERERKRQEKQRIKEARGQMNLYVHKLAAAAELNERQAVIERASRSPLAALKWEEHAPVTQELQPQPIGPATNEPSRESVPLPKTTRSPSMRFDVIPPVQPVAAEAAIVGVA
jgi:hypothetical protein